MEGNDSPWLKMRFLEMPEVKRHDDGGPTGNRRGKNVPVFLVVCHGHLQGFQFPTPRLAVGVEDQAQKLVYFARDFLLDVFDRFFSWSVCGSSAAGRK